MEAEWDNVSPHASRRVFVADAPTTPGAARVIDPQVAGVWGGATLRVAVRPFSRAPFGDPRRHVIGGSKQMATKDQFTAILSCSAVLTDCHPQNASCVQNGCPSWAGECGAVGHHP
jgi:hypothetical protein